MPKTDEVKKLREATGAGVMDAKRALEEAQGDAEKAAEIIKARGLIRAEAKSSREIKAGLIKTYTHNDRVGVVLRVGCETDFVARSEPFRSLVHDLAMQIVAMDPQDVEELMKQNFIKNESITIEELVKENIARTGENIRIDNFHRLEL